MYVVVFLMTGVAVQAQDNKAYEQAMVKMLEVSKTMDGMKQMAPQIINMLKQQSTGVPEEFWKELEQEMTGMYDEIIKAMVPIYQKYLTLEDIKEITKFYETPIGKKLADTNTKIAMEAMPIAQQIAMQNMQKFANKMKEKGYIK